jgi:O-antigen/teichoic acid export membrane protein
MESQQNTKKQILKSTGIVGGSQVVIIIIGIVRTKILAVLLGPIGVGLAGLYQSVAGLINVFTSLGLNNSAVKDIAQAAGTNDESKISRVVHVLQKWVWFTGLLGAAVAIMFCSKISQATFGSKKYAIGVAFLSINLLFVSLSAGRLALLQGLRKITAMAKANILGATIGLITAIPLYWFYGQKAIVPVLILMAATNFFVSYFFSKNIKIAPQSITFRATFLEGLGMVQLGFFLVVTTLVDSCVMYLVRSFIAHKGGIEAVGQLTAATTISNMYLSAIFIAMSADYYPRIAAVSNDNLSMKKLVNDQAEISLLVASPVIITMISFIGLVVHLFYSKYFYESANILSWQLAGDFFKVISWPVGFIFLAKGKGKAYVLTNSTWSILYLSSVYIGWDWFGLSATGIAFGVSYVIFALVTYLLCRYYYGFRFSKQVLQSVSVFFVLVCLAFCSSHFLTGYVQYVIGAGVSLLAILFSVFNLKKMLPLAQIISQFKTKLTGD